MGTWIRIKPSRSRPSGLLAAVAAVVMLASALDGWAGDAAANDRDQRELDPLFRVIDIDIDERKTVTLPDGTEVEIRLLDLREETEPVLGSIEQASVRLAIDGEEIAVQAGLYNLPVTVGPVQIDAPVTGGYNAMSHVDHWALEKDARLRLWPADSPWIRPGTFVYPLRQRWMASGTWYANESVVVRLPDPDNPTVYYHAGLDLGGAEGLDEIVAATDGQIISLGDSVADEVEHPGNPRYDVVYIRDARGWVYRYSHLDRFDERLSVGDRVTAGTRLGWLGKRGGSGGWAHLHFHILAPQPSGRWGIQDAYAFLHQAYRAEHAPDVLAVARPRRVTLVDRAVELDASPSWAATGVAEYRWTFGDGEGADGPVVERVYDRPGTYVETVKVTDAAGNFDYDFATVHVFDLEAGIRPPNLHAAFHPTHGIEPGDEVTFMVRAFRHDGEGEDVWDFGDGSDPVVVQSGTAADQHAPLGEGYVAVTHRFEEPGHYLVTVRRETPTATATDRLHVPVGIE